MCCIGITEIERSPMSLQEAGIKFYVGGRSITWADYNSDGKLDLFVSRGDVGPLKRTLYRQDGDGPSRKSAMRSTRRIE